MSLFEKIFGKKESSAAVAKDRLKVMLACERASCNLPQVKEMESEIANVLEKYVEVNGIQIKTEHNRNIDMMEIEVKLK